MECREIGLQAVGQRADLLAAVILPPLGPGFDAGSVAASESLRLDFLQRLATFGARLQFPG